MLLDFLRHHGIVIGAVEQTGKCNIMLSVLGFVVAPEYGLHLVKQFGADQRRLRAAVKLFFPNELPFIKGIL
jgi:hypothetical protein